MCLAPYKLHRKNTKLSSFPHKVQSQVLKLKERLILNTYLLNKFEMQLGSFLTFEIE